MTPSLKSGTGGFVAFAISIFFYLVAAMKLLNDILNNVPEFGQLLAAMADTVQAAVLDGALDSARASLDSGVQLLRAIEALRAIGKANNGKLPLDLTERCVKVELVEEDPCEQYTDLDANAWYAESVHFALVNGLFVGFGDGTFRPEAALSRAMVATVLYR